MLLSVDAKVNDSICAEYKFYWTNPISFKKEFCTIFTYGQGKEMAIAIFQTIYPDCKIARIEELEKVS